MISALTEDEDRNRAITANIIANKGHHQLVISKRLNHLHNIAAMLEEANFVDPVVTIIGKDDNEHRRSAKALAEGSPCVILSTLADEAMDIPRLDRLHLIFPQKNAGLVTQQVGRVERVHKDKTESLIFDYCDLNIGPLENQWRTRRFEVYESRGYEIITMKLENIFTQSS
jgi:superfamily II DNA or RNA helicase